MRCLVFLLLAAPLFAVCTTATTDCTEKVPLTEAGRYSLVYRSHALDKPNPAIRRGVIVIHGIGRNADWYFGSGMASAFLAGALEDSVVIAPRFAANQGGRCQDKLADGEISWACAGWNAGEEAPGIPGLYSYALIDALVKRLADKNLFPNMKLIVVSGHSAGGQYVHRYLAATAVPDEVEAPVRFVVANPSSYLYLDPVRPAASLKCDPVKGCAGEFAAFNGASGCATYDRWRYGLHNRTGYAAKATEEELRSRMISRSVTYLLGEWDNLPGGSLDESCNGMAQGANRLARGLAYQHYINSRHGAKHTLVISPACGHNARCMFSTDPALPVMFPPYQ
ncbi:MAG: alpha/beta fold hydrolase [Acidimicrobiia bacterium]|nr:alpha/beta fold hydrolase [Acidimicrobiia bacterium]